MLSMHYFDRVDGEIKDFDFEPEDVVEFGIINYKEYTKKNEFKTWNKKAFIRVKNGQRIESYDIQAIKELKEALKGKYETEKHTECEYKNFNEKKAIDWYYTVKEAEY